VALTSLINKIFTVITSVLIISCTGLKKLPPGEKLYTGFKIILVHTDQIKNKKDIIAAAKSAVWPAPNKSFFGIRPGLWAYLTAGNPEKKGFRQWLKKKGEPPVLITDMLPAETSKFIDAKLFNIGIFNVKTEYKIIEKEKTSGIIYTVHIHEPFTLEKIQYALNDQKAGGIINTEVKNSLLKKGDDYNLETLTRERERIDGLLKDNGYFYFNPDYLLFKADTSIKNKTISLTLTLKENTPEKALKIYRINKVIVYNGFNLTEGYDSLDKNHLMVDSVIFAGKKNRVKPSVLMQSIKLKKNEIYSLQKHNITLNRLMNLGTFKFVRVQFKETDSLKGNFLNTCIFLTPLPKRSLRTEINMVSKSNDFVGPQLNINHLDRNALNGAELLSLNAGASFETQLSGKYKNLFSYSFNTKAEILVPRFIAPFKIRNVSSFYVPKTKFSLAYNYLQRIQYFDLNSFQFVYGFKWKESEVKGHELNPVNINLTSIGNRTPEFNALLESNPFIKKSYEEQFIAGAVYSYLYNEQVLNGKKEQLYFNVTTETSGNILSLPKIFEGKGFSGTEPSKIGGNIYSQFFKISFDLRNYINLNTSKLVWRIFTGIGKPYGNSSTLPYIKQYFSGGPNSVRAFPINSVGPGANTSQNSGAFLFLQQGGDIKFESNIEYRFNIWKSFKGAVFTDAGNIWLFKNNPGLNGDAFSFLSFYKEIAAGAGLGIRFDATFFILRFDLATPIRKPWLPENERWVINRIKPGDRSWRNDNLILNVAIGYPF
jgi:outer membrane protein insertion porin family